MAMTSSSSPAQKEETLTVSGATKRSSSVGRAFTRFFSRSPPEKTAQRSTSEASALGPPNPGSSQGSDGGVVRGRTPPRGLDTSSPTTDATFGQSSQPPNPNSPQFHCFAPKPNKQHHTTTTEGNLGGLLLQQSHSRAAMAMSHRGGHPTIQAADGGTGGLRTETTRATTSTVSAPANFSFSSQDPSIGGTEVIVQYSVPDGQRFLPITLGPHVTMIHVGRHDGKHVYEPTNQWLRSPEEGLRFHRSMREDDVYDGPLDLARFGQAVVGPLSDDQKWLVNPLSYDPTRPSGVASADASAEQVSMATPTHEPATLGSYAALPTDIEVSLLAELGQAVTRGAESVSHGQQSPTAEPAHDAHAALPVPLTAPHTPETAVASPFGAPNFYSFGAPLASQRAPSSPALRTLSPTLSVKQQSLPRWSQPA